MSTRPAVTRVVCWTLAALCAAAASTSHRAAVHQLTLQPEMNANMFWTVDYRLQEVEVEVRADLAPSQWLGVGFSDDGALPGADLWVLWVDWRRHVHIQHAWVDKAGRVSVDHSVRDLRAEVGEVADRHGNSSGLRFRRAFDTCRPRDYVIEVGTTHVVWVSGSGPLLTLNRLQATHFPSGFVRTQLLRPELVPPPPLPAGTTHLDVTSRNVSVPGRDTTYWCTVHRLPEAFTRKQHVIRYEAVIEKGNEELVHHMEVFHCEAPPQQRFPPYEGPCHAANRPKLVDKCKRVLAAWAMGAEPLIYPQEAGLPVGGSDFNLYVMLEVHYNNPKLKTGFVDSSGMRLTYTGRLRRHDAAVMELGLEYTDKMAIPSGQSEFELAGYCVPGCTAVGLPVDGIHVFASQLHTHLTGVAVKTQHVRSDGTQMADLNRDPHYSSHYQEIRLLPELRLVLPGDALITRCTHRTEQRQNVTLGGFSITDEMCVNYIHYFPKTRLEVCKSSIDSRTLTSYFAFMNKWEDQPTEENLGWGDNYRRIKWNALRSKGLQQLYEASPLSMQCNQSNGDRFAGYWEAVPLPTVRLPLPKPQRCPTHQ